MTQPSSSLDWLISVDDHILEPPNVWQDRLPARYKEAGPRLVRRDGDEFWAYEDRKVRTSGLSAGGNAERLFQFQAATAP